MPWIFKFGEVRPRRERIQSRLVTLIDKVVKDAKFDAVIFVAHSQGSVVAYDYLHRDHSETGKPCAASDAATGLPSAPAPITPTG